jgi:hypothetical protein
VDIGQQADEGIANELSSVFCWVYRPAIPQINLKAFGRSLFLEIQPSRITALRGHSAKSLKDGDISRWLMAIETL